MPNGVRFLNRLVPILWVMGWRFFIALLPVLILGIAAFHFVSEASVSSQAMPLSVLVLIVPLIGAVFFAYVGSKMREIAQSPYLE